MSFVDLFSDDAGDEEPEPTFPVEHRRPEWLGPPEGELGVAVPVGSVLARSDRGVVAVSHALAYSTGISFELVAHVAGLRPGRSDQFFHAQHIAHRGRRSDADDLPEEFLRVGVELADGARASNLTGRRPWGLPGETRPAGPLLVHAGGQGGQATETSATWSVAFWLWPLPPDGPLRLYCEWPAAGIALASAQVDAGALRRAAAGAARLWSADESSAGTRGSSSMVQLVSAGRPGPPPPQAAAAVPSEPPATDAPARGGRGAPVTIGGEELDALRAAARRVVEALDRLSGGG